MLKSITNLRALLLFGSLLLPLLGKAQPPKPNLPNTTISSVTYSTASTLHLVLIANTDEIPAPSNDIRLYVRADTANVRQTLAYINYYYLPDMKIEIHEIVGNDFEKDKIIAKIKAIKCTKNDVIWTIYDSHGFRFSDTHSKFPWLFMHRKTTEFAPDSTNAMHLEELHKLLKEKNTRLTITTANACNDPKGFSTKSGLVVFGEAKEPATFIAAKKRFYAHLFLHSTGDIIASSYNSGEESYACEDPSTKVPTGTFYNLDMMKALLLEGVPIDNYPKNWEAFFTTLDQKVADDVRFEKGKDGKTLNLQQHPIHQISTHTNEESKEVIIDTGLH